MYDLLCVCKYGMLSLLLYESVVKSLTCSFGSHAANDGGQSAVLVTSSFLILGLEHHAQRVEKRVMLLVKFTYGGDSFIHRIGI